VEKKITARTRAIVVVHLWGMPSKMTELFEIAGRHNLKIVEDASHAHGAQWRGRKCGTLGDVSVFSLQTSKLAPAGEGGMLLTSNAEIYERAVCLGDMTRILELESPARRFAATTFGIKTRMASLSAAVGRSQLAKLEERNERRNANLFYLSEPLDPIGMETFLPPAHVSRVYFEFIIRYKTGDGKMPLEILVEALKAEGCSVSLPRYPLLHQQPIFTEGAFADIAGVKDRNDIRLPIYKADALPQTEAANQELIKLPSFPSANRELLDQYAAAFEKVLTHAEEITKRDEG